MVVMKIFSSLSWFTALIAALAFAFFFSGNAKARELNLEKSGVAIQGYDPVAYFADRKPIKGNPAINSSYKGAKYHFSSAAHKKMFDANPSKYEPAFGGWCAWGVVKGSKVKIDPDVFQIAAGRLLLQYSEGVRNKFNEDVDGNLGKADTNWPEVSKK